MAPRRQSARSNNNEGLIMEQKQSPTLTCTWARTNTRCSGRQPRNYKVLVPVQKNVANNLEPVVVRDEANLLKLTIPNNRKGKSSKSFICITCSKEFRSYNALGGHRSSHKKAENKRKRERQRQQEEQRQLMVHNGGGVFDCDWCQRTFLKKQGLATHHRFCHNRREHLQNQIVPFHHNFDLNQLPPEAFLPEELLMLQY